METAEQRDQRIARLEAQRAEKRADVGSIWPTPDMTGTGVQPLELGPGRGDLRYASGFVPIFPTALQLTGPFTVSFARIFMSQPWVAGAVMRMLTWTSRVPLNVYKATGSQGDPHNKIKVPPDAHPLARAVTHPWHRGSQLDLITSALGQLLVHGNSLMQILRGNRAYQENGSEVAFRYQDWRFARPVMPVRFEVDAIEFNSDLPQYRETVPYDQTLHLRWWSPVLPMGCSPLQQLGTTIQIEDAAQRYQRALFAQGAKPPTAITMTPEFLGMDRVKREKIQAQLREDIMNLYVGPENAGKPALLPPGLDWKPIGFSTVEAELINQRKVAREEIAAVYMIPPPLLGILDRATYANIQVQRDMTYTECVGPPAILFEQAVNAQVLRDLLQDDSVVVEFDFGAVLRGDRLQEIDAVRNAIGSALLTPNEGRGIIGEPRIENVPGMDQTYLPLVNNLTPVGTPSVQVPGTPPPMDVPTPPDQPGRRGNGHHPGRHLHIRSALYDGEVELVS